ncbi:hypothetical protein HUU42_10325 [bacterium]|nr:hypothetical protein [bacterium]
MQKMLDSFSEKAKIYLTDIEKRNVFPTKEALKNLSHLDIDLQDTPISPETVLNELDAFGSPATVASIGNRYFGFVIGGSIPAALDANLLAGVWDQNAFSETSSPLGAYIETICAK